VPSFDMETAKNWRIKPDQPFKVKLPPSTSAHSISAQVVTKPQASPTNTQTARKVRPESSQAYEESDVIRSFRSGMDSIEQYSILLRGDRGKHTVNNGFSTMDLVKHGGLPSKHMVAYLCRTGILIPSMSEERRRGVRRKFSYEDLLLARAVSTLLKAGVSVEGLKKSLHTLRRMLTANPALALSRCYVGISGKHVLIEGSAKSLIDLAANGQLAFHFVLDTGSPKRKSAGLARKEVISSARKRAA
jgi:DNA-binding transcriptional MerR regulator